MTVYDYLFQSSEALYLVPNISHFLLFIGFIANIFSIGVLSTKDMRKHSFNQLLIALCIFDLLFIGVSIPVYSFNLYGILMDNQVNGYLIYLVVAKRMNDLFLEKELIITITKLLHFKTLKEGPSIIQINGT